MSEITPTIESERRLVTVMFADICGFTAMSERLDPEEVSEIMNECFRFMGECIEQHGGTIDTFMGDCWSPGASTKNWTASRPRNTLKRPVLCLKKWTCSGTWVSSRS